MLGRRYGFALLALVAILVFFYVVLKQKEVELEIAKFELRLSELQRAALVKDAELIAKNERQKAQQLEGGNPFLWLEIQPHEYVGEGSIGDESIAGGSWLYDPGAGLFAYKLDRARVDLIDSSHLDTRLSGWLQFRVVRLRSKNNKEKVVNHLGIASVQHFRWRQE